MSLPQLPADFAGSAKYQALGTVRSGRIVSVEILTLEHGEGHTRKIERAAKQSIAMTLHAYQCERDGTFEQRFAFNEGKAPQLLTSP